MKGRIKVKIPKFKLKEINKMLRSKKDIIELIVSTLLIYLNKKDLEGSPSLSDEDIIYISSNMQRVFFQTENKYFSVHFPFTIDELNNLITFTGKKEIISKRGLSIINQSVKGNDTLPDSYDTFYYGLDEEGNGGGYSNLEISSAWMIYFSLIALETGYLRYDYDPTPDRVDEKHHPLNHLDIFYNNTSTFKIGLYNKPKRNDFIDILDSEKECLYLSKFIDPKNKKNKVKKGKKRSK